MADLSRARYTLALQRSYNTTAAQPDSAVRRGVIPAPLNGVAGLNFLSPKGLIHTPHVLVSAGQYLPAGGPPTGIVGLPRPRPFTVLGDSGGFQFIGTQPWLGNASRQAALAWLEAHCDEAMTLDIPTRAIGINSQFPDFNACLQETLANLAYFEANRSPGKVRYLNVLQGRDRRELRAWYKAVRAYPFEGWAFGGAMRLNMYAVCNLILDMLGHGDLAAGRARLHFLGTSSLKAAVLLTGLQRALRAHLQTDDVLITFDSSSPSTMMSNALGYAHPQFGPSGFGMTSQRVPCTHHYLGDQRFYPGVGVLGRAGLRLGDMCVVHSHTKQTAWDRLAEAMVTLDNYSALVDGIEQANRWADLEPVHRANSMPLSLSSALVCISKFLSEQNPNAYLGHYKQELEMLSGTSEPDERS